MGKEQKIDFDNNLENSKRIVTVTEDKQKTVTVELPLDTPYLENIEEDKSLTERLIEADREKAEVEEKYSVAMPSLEAIDEKIKSENIQKIQALYNEGIFFYKNGENDLALSKMKEGVAIDADYYLSWFGQLQILTDDLKDLEHVESFADIYDNSLLHMDTTQKEQYAKEYTEQIQQKIDSFSQVYQALEVEDEQLRKEYLPKYEKGRQKCKPVFWTMFALALFFIAAMATTWPFLHVVAGEWIAYLAIVCTALAGIFLLLFFIFAMRLLFFYRKIQFCKRLGNSIYGEDMRKIAKEREKYIILLEDLTIKTE